MFLHGIEESGKNRDGQKRQDSGGKGGELRRPRRTENSEKSLECGADEKASGGETMEANLILVGSGAGEFELPNGAHAKRNCEKRTERSAEVAGRKKEIKSARKGEATVRLEGEKGDECVSCGKDKALPNVGRRRSGTGRSIFKVQMKKEGGRKTQAGAQHGPGKGGEKGRGLGIVDLRVEREKRTAIETKESETEKKEDTLEIALSAIAEDQHHPKEHEQGASSVANQAEVEEDRHSSDAATRKYCYPKADAENR
jgi:hypothetical protein